MEPLLTYHGDDALKVAFLREIAAHEAADQLIKGTYGRMNGHFRGCAIGCSLHSLNRIQGKPELEKTDAHARIPTELGWPLWLAYLEDHIFERLPDDLARTWPRRLAEAIPVGAEIPDRVLAQVLRWTLVAETYGCIHATDDVEVKAIVARMGALFDRSIAGDEPSETEWREAARAARAAWDARTAWAAWAAWAACWDAWDAWDVRAASAAMDAFYPALSEEVLRLLRELQPGDRSPKERE